MDLQKLGKDLLSNKEVESIYTYAFAQYHSGHWAQASDAFRILCTRRPLESRFWFGLGASLQEAGSYMDALHAWAMASLLKKEDPYPHFHAAECYFSLREDVEAAKALRETERIIDATHPLWEKIMLLKEQWKKMA